MTAPAAPSAELWASVDRLCKPARQRLTRDDRTIERVTLPSLLDQLTEAIESGAGASAHGVQVSKPPLDTAALALLIKIASTVRADARYWRKKRTFDTAKDLRQVASAVIAYGEVKLIDAYSRMIFGWCAQIRTVISSDPDRTWRMHGGRCRVCSSTTVPAFDEEGVETRQPALIVHSADGIISKIECGFCGSVLSDDELTAVVLNTQRRALKRLVPFPEAMGE